jgi:hypothetical protein
VKKSGAHLVDGRTQQHRLERRTRPSIFPIDTTPQCRAIKRTLTAEQQQALSHPGEQLAGLPGSIDPIAQGIPYPAGSCVGVVDHDPSVDHQRDPTRGHSIGRISLQSESKDRNVKDGGLPAGCWKVDRSAPATCQNLFQQAFLPPERGMAVYGLEVCGEVRH